MNATRVLLVDDSEDVRVLIAAKLARTGRYEVIGEADEGSRGVQAAEQLAPDLIVLDLSMPGLSGLETIPLLRAAAPEARIIVMSGHAENSLIEQVLAAGATGFVEKSLRVDVVTTIDNILESGRALDVS
jgi:DNA-binding NarL/FixJ family response regulator